MKRKSTRSRDGCSPVTKSPASSRAIHQRPQATCAALLQVCTSLCCCCCCCCCVGGCLLLFGLCTALCVLISGIGGFGAWMRVCAVCCVLLWGLVFFSTPCSLPPPLLPRARLSSPQAPSMLATTLRASQTGCVAWALQTLASLRSPISSSAGAKRTSCSGARKIVLQNLHAC